MSGIPERMDIEIEPDDIEESWVVLDRGFGDESESPGQQSFATSVS